MTEEQQKEAAKALAEQQAAIRKQDEEFQKMLETPLDEDEARKRLANFDVQLAQLAVVRARKLDELNQLDIAIKTVAFDRSIVMRRVLNPSQEAEG